MYITKFIRKTEKMLKELYKIEDQYIRYGGFSCFIDHAKLSTSFGVEEAYPYLDEIPRDKQIQRYRKKRAIEKDYNTLKPNGT